MSEIAELIAALRAWGPLVSSGHEVPAAGGVMHRAADQLESYQRVAVASGTIMQDQVQALAVAERNATEAAATLTRLAGEREEWQDIASAPKDGTRFLTFDDHYGVRIGRAFIRSDHDDWLSYVDCNGNSSKGGIRATHWRPLPAPPHREGKP